MSGPGLRVVVSPHLDDAVLSAWLALDDLPGTRVVTCFTGDPPDGCAGSWDARTGLAGNRAAETRRAEDRRALLHTGSLPVHLDLPDAQYRHDASEDDTTARLVDALAPHVSGADEVWLPAGLGGHVDHLLARRATLRASAGTARRFLYADLPYAGQPAWPVQVTWSLRDAAVHVASPVLGRLPPAESWRATLAEVPGVAWDSPHVHALTPRQRRRKLAALDEYATQLGVLRCARRNVLRRRRLFRYEASWFLGRDGRAPQG